RRCAVGAFGTRVGQTLPRIQRSVTMRRPSAIFWVFLCFAGCASQQVKQAVQEAQAAGEPCTWEGRFQCPRVMKLYIRPALLSAEGGPAQPGAAAVALAAAEADFSRVETEIAQAAAATPPPVVGVASPIGISIGKGGVSIGVPPKGAKRGYSAPSGSVHAA